jgi:hypothetical protein
VRAVGDPMAFSGASVTWKESADVCESVVILVRALKIVAPRRFAWDGHVHQEINMQWSCCKQR